VKRPIDREGNEVPETRAPAAAIAHAVRAGRESASDVVVRALDRIAATDPAIGVFLTVDRDGARRAAERVDAKRASGELLGPLAGVPVAIKDNLCTRGLRTTCASRMLDRFMPPYDATVVARLRAADAIIVGKTNLDEFAMGSSCEHSAFHPARNPWDTERVPGGSSGGSAAAVAADLVPLAIGSDTGGSIRQPAALCGIVGLKPTYGRVSRYGLIAFASSLDQVGPMPRGVADAALALSVLAGADPLDATSSDRPVADPLEGLDAGVAGLRLGMPDEYFGDAVEPEVRDAVAAAVALLRDAGATIEPCSLPHAPWAVPSYFVVANSEASSNLARFDGVRFGPEPSGDDVDDPIARTTGARSRGFGAEVRRRILLGTFALSAGYHDRYYQRALRVRSLLRSDFDRAFSEFDALVAPTSPFPAFRLGEKVHDPVEMYACDILTAGTNLAGHPAVSIPTPVPARGLPVGLQILGPEFSEPRLLRIARVVERASGGFPAAPIGSSTHGEAGP